VALGAERPSDGVAQIVRELFANERHAALLPVASRRYVPL
jgi:hypothetical protein